jgi:hypothetical protein
MSISRRARAFAVLAASASLVAVPLAAPSSAAVPGKCTKLTTKTVAGKITATLTNCTPVKATGGKGGGTFASSGKPNGSLNITIKWAAGKGTTKANILFKTEKTLRGCPTVKGTTRITITGKVTGGTGVAFKTFKKGQAVNGSVCSGPKGITLEKGKALTF